MAPGRAATPVAVLRPKQAAHGDYATNVALQHAKALSRNPREFAAALIAALPPSPLVERAEIAGAGFVNVFVTPAARQAVVGRVLAERDRYGRSDARRGERVMVEFVSANPTGPAARRPRPAGGARRRRRGAARVAGRRGHARVLLQRRRAADPEPRGVGPRARAGAPRRARVVSRGRLPRRVHPRDRAALPRGSRARPRRHRVDPPLRGRRAAARAGPRPAGVRRALRQLLPRELALRRRARRGRGVAARGVRASPTSPRARCG